MKAIEKKVLENLLKQLDEELKESNIATDYAYENVIKNNYDKDSYMEYTRKYSYLNGIQYSKTIVIKELRKLGIEVK
jgi:hypothetical protein